MVQYLTGFALAAVAIAAPALAADEPVIAPAPAWVESPAIPDPDPDQAGKPFQSLLLTSQARYDPDGAEIFLEWATLIQDPQGLAGLGTIAIPWQPQMADLIVHKVRIIREGKVIDILGNGQTFTVLRRENNLEMATLDGILTAVIQPEGLAVGDVIDVAFSMRMKDGSIPFRAENMLVLPPGIVTRHLLYRQLWPASVDMEWKADPAMGKVVARKTDYGTELIVDLKDVEPAAAPADAPARFRLPPSLQLSDYESWGEISALLAPVYEKAGQLSPQSPLQAEINGIAAGTTDPRARAMAALRTVQDKVRYVFLGMNEGGYIPASAEQTWARKFGDCKGKTVTLIALLHGLGIEAEPVLVNSGAGDSLGGSLPQVHLFDHVIVRAEIDGRSYWLDGTRAGDRRIEALTSSPFRYGLPVRAAGAELEPLPLVPPSAPLVESSVTYDASNGFERPVPASGQVIFRGDMATVMRLGHAQLGDEAFEEKAKGFAPVPSDDLTATEFKRDDDDGTFTMSFTGKASMDWENVSGSNARRFEFDDDTISWNVKFQREKGPFEDAPFALSFPVYLASRETVILPDDGRGFTITGKDLDRTVAGTRIKRTLSLEGDKAVAYSTFQRLQPELGAAEAAASVDAIKAINDDEASVRTPAGYQPSQAEIASILGEEPTEASGYIERGYRFMAKGEFTKAIENFDKAIELSPQWSRALSNKGVALVHLERLDEAEQILARAQALDEDDFVVHQGYGMLYFARDEPAKAIDALTRSLVYFPENEFTLGERALAHQRLGNLDASLADIDRILTFVPESRSALELQARLKAVLSDEAGALAAVDRLIAAEPENISYLAHHGEFLRRFGRPEEAREAYARALVLTKAQIAKTPDDRQLKQLHADILAQSGDTDGALREIAVLLAGQPDNVSLLNQRCWLRATANVELEKALADCELALRYDPENAAATDSRALVMFRLGRIGDAIADLDKAIEWQPKQAASLYLRGIARRRAGDAAGGDKDIAAARSLVFDIGAEYESYGITP